MSAAPIETVLRVQPGRDLPDLESARDRLRSLRRQGRLDHGADVIPHGGVYQLDRSFTLTAEDSGTAFGPNRYRAAAGEDVRLAGGLPSADTDKGDMPA